MLFLPENIEEYSRKERERLFKRMEILNAAVVLFAENGYQNTTIDLIAEKAEFGKGTIYNYFKGKEDIYWAILDDIFMSYLGAVKKVDSLHENYYEFMLQITEEVFSFCVTNLHAFVMVTRLRTSTNTYKLQKRKSVLQYQTEVDEIFEERAFKAIKKGEIKKVNIKSLITLYRSMIFPYAYHKMFCENSDDIDVKTESKLIVDILFNGIENN